MTGADGSESTEHPDQTNECTRECLAIRVARRLDRYEVIAALTDGMLLRKVPKNIRYGPEFISRDFLAWCI